MIKFYLPWPDCYSPDLNLKMSCQLQQKSSNTHAYFKTSDILTIRHDFEYESDIWECCMLGQRPGSGLQAHPQSSLYDSVLSDLH